MTDVSHAEPFERSAGPPDASDPELVAAFSEPPGLVAAFVLPTLLAVRARPVAAALTILGCLGAALLGALVLSGGSPPSPDPVLVHAAVPAPSGSADDSPSSVAPGGRMADDRNGAAREATNQAEHSEIVVAHVVGAVAVPGVVVLEGPVRVHDAIQAAGGARADADLARLNLAAPLFDGARIYVPALGEAELPAEVAPSRPDAPSSSGSGSVGDGGDPAPVSLSSASAAELETLPGIGPALARAIIEHREREGPFVAVDDLVAVSGIGAAKLETLRPLVVP